MVRQVIKYYLTRKKERRNFKISYTDQVQTLVHLTSLRAGLPSPHHILGQLLKFQDSKKGGYLAYEPGMCHLHFPQGDFQMESSLSPGRSGMLLLTSLRRSISFFGIRIHIPKGTMWKMFFWDSMQKSLQWMDEYMLLLVSSLATTTHGF